MTTTVTTAVTLLPCPFCGNAAVIEMGGQETFYVVRCGGRCYVNSSTGSYSRDDVVAQWNTRAQSTATAVCEHGYIDCEDCGDAIHRAASDAPNSLAEWIDETYTTPQPSEHRAETPAEQTDGYIESIRRQGAEMRGQDAASGTGAKRCDMMYGYRRCIKPDKHRGQHEMEVPTRRDTPAAVETVQPTYYGGELRASSTAEGAAPCDVESELRLFREQGETVWFDEAIAYMRQSERNSMPRDFITYWESETPEFQRCIMSIFVSWAFGAYKNKFAAEPAYDAELSKLRELLTKAVGSGVHTGVCLYPQRDCSCWQIDARRLLAAAARDAMASAGKE